MRRYAVMLDTVDMRITAAEVRGVDFANEVTPRLDPGGVSFHDFDGVRVVRGTLDDLTVTASPGVLKVGGGSLCKWMLGDNYQALTRADIRRAVERLSDALHMPMRRAIVTRLDVGACIPMKQPPANYFNHLGELRHTQRLQQPGGIYYYQARRCGCLCFYDKNREQRAHGEPIPAIYDGCHVLRYEQRYLQRLPALLHVPKVTAALLSRERFYICLLDRWRDTYHAIRKVNDITLNFQMMRSKQQLYKMGVAAIAERMGGELAMLAHIDEAQRRGDLTRKQAYDLRQAVRDACSAGGGVTVPVEAVEELNKKIDEAIRYYR